MKKLFFVALLSLTSVSSFAAGDAAKENISQQVSQYDKMLQEVKDFEKSDKFKPELLTAQLPFDINYGNPDAPVKIVEYASLTCHHCKDFHKEVFYNIKKEFIDTGKVSFKFRHYPLNGAAIKAAMIVDCVGDLQKNQFLGALFESQTQWAYVESEANLIDRLRTISKIGGMNDADFDKCYNNKENENKLLGQMKQAYDQLNVNATPAIFINGTRYMGARNFESVKNAVLEMEKLSASKPVAPKSSKTTSVNTESGSSK